MKAQVSAMITRNKGNDGTTDKLKLDTLRSSAAPSEEMHDAWEVSV
jgi:hypothetical protein